MKLQVCGGCNAKISASSLKATLDILEVFKRKEVLEGFAKNDDAAIIKLSDDIAVALTCDFFPPMVEDPFAFGELRRQMPFQIFMPWVASLWQHLT